MKRLVSVFVVAIFFAVISMSSATVGVGPQTDGDTIKVNGTVFTVVEEGGATTYAPCSEYELPSANELLALSKSSDGEYPVYNLMQNSNTSGGKTTMEFGEPLRFVVAPINKAQELLIIGSDDTAFVLDKAALTEHDGIMTINNDALKSQWKAMMANKTASRKLISKYFPVKVTALDPMTGRCIYKSDRNVPAIVMNFGKDEYVKKVTKGEYENVATFVDACNNGNEKALGYLIKMKGKMNNR